MNIVTDENGIMNSFASEPQMYHADAPSSQERKYLFGAAIATAVTITSVITAIVVS